MKLISKGCHYHMNKTVYEYVLVKKNEEVIGRMKKSMEE